MANITLAGTLRDPNGDLAVGDTLRFTHKSSTGETVQTAVSFLTIPPNGQYSVDIEYGLVRIDYKDLTAETYTNLGVVTVNQDNPATSIPELLRATVPATNQEMLEFQAILANCVTAENNAAQSAIDAANSASSINNIINDLSQAYIFDTVADYQASTIVFPVGKTIHLNETKSNYVINTSITPTELDIASGVGQVAIVQELPSFNKTYSATDIIPSFSLPFSFSTNQNNAFLITDLEKYFPDGWDIPELLTPPINYLTLLATTWNTTGVSDVYRYTVSPWEGGEYQPSENVLGASLMNNKTGKKYTPRPETISASLLNDGEFRTYITSTGNLETLVRDDSGAPIASDVELQIPVGNQGLSNDVVYVDKNNGDNNNSGYSWYDAKSTVLHALTLGKKKIFVNQGVYLLGETMGTYTASQDVTIEGKGNVYFTSSPAPVSSWTATGQAQTWTSPPPNSSTYVGMWAINYKDEFGSPYLFKKVNSVAEVSANVGSWYQLSGGSAIYIHMPDSLQPPDDSVYPTQSSPIRHAADANVMIKNIDFIGGSGGAYSGRDSTQESRSVVVDCGFYLNHSADGYQIKDIGSSIAINCKTANNFNDGFNYHERNGVTPNSIEVNCTGLTAQALGTGNGSTLHEDCVIFRLNCEYHYNEGKAVADIEQSKSVNVNLNTSKSGYINSDTNADGYSFSGDEYWLINSYTSQNTGEPVRIYEQSTLHLLGSTIERSGVVIEDLAVLSLTD